MAENSETKQMGRFKEILEILHKHEILKGLTPEKVRGIIEDMGPTFIKLGQILSMHAEMIPKEYCAELEKLRTDVPPMPFDEVRRIMEKEYGKPIDELFEKVEEAPLGAASIAQAHKVTLKDDSIIVIKVQREGIYETMESDIAMLHKAAKLLKYNKRLDAVDLDQVIDQLWTVAQEEMNFLHEAGNIEKFAELNKDIKYVACPKLYREYTTRHVLAMEFISGISVADKEELENAGYDRQEIGVRLIENYLKQILDDGFFHADPHPGNMSIRDGKIVWIDMGMMGALSVRERELVFQIVNGVATRNSDTIKDALLSLGEIKGRVNHHRLLMDIDDIIQKYATTTLGGISLSKVLDDFFDALGRNEIVIPGNLTMLVRGLSTIEGVVVDLAPEVDIIGTASLIVKQRFWERFDLKHEIQSTTTTLYTSMKKMLDIPGTLSDFLHVFMKGQSRVNLDLHATADMSRLIKDVAYTIVFVIIVAALLISSSLICLTDMTPRIFEIPLLGFIGYVAALVLAIIMLINMYKSRKKDQQDLDL